MVMEVEIVSKELIKPTSPTPHHLRTHKLSFLDQLFPPISVPVVLFYMNQQTNIPPADIIARRSRLLKEFLGQTLTLFYPFAGRIKDSLSIDCNDEGAYYAEARVNRPLCEFLELNDTSYVSQLVPTDVSWTALTPEGFIAMIQVTTFECCGFVIGASLSHVIADGPGATTFISSWAEATRKCGDKLSACPNFDASLVFPHKVAYPMEATFLRRFSPFLKRGICRSMRIVFDASRIASLKAKTASSSVPDPTRVEVISALLSKCIMDTLNAKSDIKKSTVISHSVNLRQRAVPKFPKHSMGSFVYMTTALVTPNETELGNLVCLLRQAIRKVNTDFVTDIQGDKGQVKFCEHMKEFGKELPGPADNIDFIGFASWCNFGVYEIDFGWESRRGLTTSSLKPNPKLSS